LASNLRDPVDSLLMVILKRSHQGPALQSIDFLLERVRRRSTPDTV